MMKTCIIYPVGNRMAKSVHLPSNRNIKLKENVEMSSAERQYILRKAGYKLYEVFPSGKVLRLNLMNYNVVNLEPEVSSSVDGPVYTAMHLPTSEELTAPFAAKTNLIVGSNKEAVKKASPEPKVEATENIAEDQKNDNESSVTNAYDNGGNTYKKMSKSEKKRLKAAQYAQAQQQNQQNSNVEEKKEEIVTEESDVTEETVTSVEE